MTLPCIICGKGLVGVFDDDNNQPHNGVVCATYGNYGSTVFDPISAEFLEFNICDGCLVKARDRQQIMLARHQRPVIVDDMGFVGYLRVPYEPYEPVVWDGSTYNDDVRVTNMDAFRTIGAELFSGLEIM